MFTYLHTKATNDKVFETNFLRIRRHSQKFNSGREQPHLLHISIAAVEISSVFLLFLRRETMQ